MKPVVAAVAVFAMIFSLWGSADDMPEKHEYKVLTLQDVEKELYSMMQTAGIAEPVKDQPGKLRIRDVAQARSENSMPLLFNRLGKEGWALSTVNNSQLYIFSRPVGAKKVTSLEYKVVTLAAIDSMIFSSLTEQKAAEPIKDQPGKFRILDVEKAKSQSIMPAVLGEFAKDNWMLAGINKSDLYIFVRKGEGKTEFDPLSEASKAAKPAQGAAADKPAGKGEVKLDSKATSSGSEKKAASGKAAKAEAAAQ